jgi:hypothetical protein
VTSQQVDLRPRRSVAQIFLIPAIFGILSGGGLVFALVEDGIWDTLSWLTLALPIVLITACIARGRA